MKSDIDYRVRSLYYVLLGKHTARKDLEAAMYIRSVVNIVTKIRGSMLVDVTNTRFTAIKDVVQMIVQDMKEEKI